MVRDPMLTPGHLAGMRVLVPRPAGRAGDLIAALREAGADAVHVPLIATESDAESPEMREAVTTLAAGGVDWVAFTSAAAVTAVLVAAETASAAGQLAARADSGGPTLVGAGTRVAAVGGATALALRRGGIPVDLIPDGAGSAAALAASWPDDPPGTSVLLPRSDRAAPTLPDALRRSGHRVRAVTAYRTVVLPVPPAIADDLAAGAFGGVLLTSPSTAQALSGTPISHHTAVVAIGRSTETEARAAGIAVTATAPSPTADALVRTLAATVDTDTAAAGPDAADSRRRTATPDHRH